MNLRAPSQVARWAAIAVAVAGALAALGPTAAVAGETVEAPSVARQWNEELLDAIRIDRPKPPVHARNLFHLSVAMWDAWAAYDPDATGYLVHEKPTATNPVAARDEAISYAAYELLRHRFQGGGIDVDDQPCQPGAATSLAAFDARMAALGYELAPATLRKDSPAALGRRIARAVIALGLTDGANEGEDLCYPDETRYRPTNPELVFELPGTVVFDPNRWQPLAFDHLILQNDIVIGQAVQSFVGVGWTDVEPFALPDHSLTLPEPPEDCGTARGSAFPYMDPGCPPQLGGAGHATVVDAVVELIRFNAWVDPRDGATIDISPATLGNAPLGTDDMKGRPLNPRTGEPYPPNVVKRADYARVLAEFWADGPDSETPPGHWNLLVNEVGEDPRLGEKRIGLHGPAVDDLQWDVVTYLALNGAMHDAAIAAWGVKHYYDSSRPITLIRHMGGLGQSSEPEGDAFHPLGLPLIPDLIERITAESSLAGERHEQLAEHVGEIALRAWAGTPEDPENEFGGVDWIRAVEWMPYQAPNFVSPPFPGYISGHSTFSRAGAEVLGSITGDPYFPGGVGRFVALQGEYLRFEDGPSETVELQWATYDDAADEAGISRRYGGIHPFYDDFPGRVIAETIGRRAVARAMELARIDSVTVCHVSGDGGEDPVTISANSDQVMVHVEHGDSFGGCRPRFRKRRD